MTKFIRCFEIILPIPSRLVPKQPDLSSPEQVSTTTSGSTRRGGASRRSWFGASLGGFCERSAMHAPILPVPVSGNDHRFSATRTRGGLPLDLLQSRLISSEITLLTRSDSGNLTTRSNSRSYDIFKQCG